MANDVSILKTFESLEKNGIHPYLVKDRNDALKKVLDLLPDHEEIMTMTSVTLTEIWLDELLNTSTEFISIRRLMNNEGLSPIEKRRLWTAHEWAIWSVHAVTENWQVMIASATWSQIPAYAYGAMNVIWIVWTQKIVKDLDEGFRRIYEYSFPLENERSMKAYWIWSWVNKLLIINKETIPGRIHMIFVKEKLWF